MTTATHPIFRIADSKRMKGRLVGVVGHDVLVSQLEEFGATFQEVLGKVIQRLSLCQAKDVDVCQLQVRIHSRLLVLIDVLRQHRMT